MAKTDEVVSNGESLVNLPDIVIKIQPPPMKYQVCVVVDKLKGDPLDAIENSGRDTRLTVRSRLLVDIRLVLGF